MIVVALLYSFTSTLGKKAIGLPSPVFFLAVYTSIVAVILAPVAFRQTVNETKILGFPTLFRSVALPGVFSTLGVIATAFALKLGPAAYAISVKRLSLPIGILYGHLIFP